MKEFIVKKRENKNYVQVTCRIEENILNKIDNIVLECNLDSRNNFINECLKFSIENMRIDK